MAVESREPSGKRHERTFALRMETLASIVDASVTTISSISTDGGFTLGPLVTSTTNEISRKRWKCVYNVTLRVITKLLHDSMSYLSFVILQCKLLFEKTLIVVR